MTNNSIVRLRKHTLFGAASLSFDGILIIGALPVALLNAFIALTICFYDTYY